MSDVCDICGLNPNAPAGCRCTDETREAYAAGAAAERARIVAECRKQSRQIGVLRSMSATYSARALDDFADALEAGGRLEERKP